MGAGSSVVKGTSLPPEIRNLNQASTKSTIIVFIMAHGKELREKLHENVVSKTIIVSTDRESAFISEGYVNETETETAKTIFKYLNKNLVEKNKTVKDVIAQYYSFDNIIPDKRLLETTMTDYVTKHTEIVKRIQQLTDKHDNDVLMHDFDSTPSMDTSNYDAALKKLQAEEKELSKKINMYAKFEASITRMNRPRVIRNDRRYAFTDQRFNTMKIIDVRYPKNDLQTIDKHDIEANLFGVMEERNYIRLSEILNTLIGKYEFDHVIIFDTACRGGGEECTFEGDQISEIELVDGNTALTSWPELGGGKTRRHKSYSYRKTKKQKFKSRRNTKKRK